ncbi:hypothetical protein [uncultured Gammaproteobacteria bacterium]|nr:hypothetical protein [uncultured Gammaproteobacteria bacterium]
MENSSYKLNEPIVNDAFEDQGVRFLDVNGDGLLDYVRGEQSYKKVYLNTGSGWQLSSSFVLPQPIVSTYTYKIPYGVYIMGRWVGDYRFLKIKLYIVNHQVCILQNSMAMA